MTDPSSIPQHVSDAAWEAFVAHPTTGGMIWAIAAALDALMDDRPVYVELAYPGDDDYAIRPSAVLAAVLERS